MMGKCISFSLAFPGAKFYIREKGQLLGRPLGNKRPHLLPPLREELAFWGFLDSWNGHFPWKKRRACSAVAIL